MRVLLIDGLIDLLTTTPKATYYEVRELAHGVCTYRDGVRVYRNGVCIYWQPRFTVTNLPEA